jgi:ribosome modulation factor
MCYDFYDYNEGVKAYSKGESVYDCPYQTLAEQRMWMIGWWNAHIEDKYVLKTS